MEKGNIIGRSGKTSISSASGIYSLEEQYLKQRNNTWPTSIVKNGLILHLDANDSRSYPGTGTVWSDISGNNNNFNILQRAFKDDGVKYMDFRGGNGIAKNATDISLSGNVTYLLWTRVQTFTNNWRTLTRGYGGDHHVIIQSGGQGLGMYDSETGAFINSGYNQTSFPNHNTDQWMFAHFRFSSTAPQYQFSYNDTPNVIRASISNANAAYNRGFGSIGGYHDVSTDPSVASQYWGDIASFMVYNRVLSDAEILQNYYATEPLYRNPHMLTPELSLAISKYGTPGLVGQYFSGDWRSTISTGNIGSLPLSSPSTYTAISYGSRGDLYGFIAIGFFRPPTTGTYTFYTSSDDGSGVWIGNIAAAFGGRTTTNAVLNNGLGVGQGDTKRSGSTTLIGGRWYPIRIVHEEGTGGDNLTFSWAGPNISETTDLSTHFRCPVNLQGQRIYGYY